MISQLNWSKCTAIACRVQYTSTRIYITVFSRLRSINRLSDIFLMSSSIVLKCLTGLSINTRRRCQKRIFGSRACMRAKRETSPRACVYVVDVFIESQTIASLSLFLSLSLVIMRIERLLMSREFQSDGSKVRLLAHIVSGDKNCLIKLLSTFGKFI